MGTNCCPERKKDYPIIIFNYDFNNMKQEEYIKNFESYLQKDKIKYFENNSNQFSIILSIFDYNHLIKNDNDLNPGTISIHLTTIYNIIIQTIDGKYFHQHIENEDFFNNQIMLLPSSFFSKKNIEGRVKKRYVHLWKYDEKGNTRRKIKKSR